MKRMIVKNSSSLGSACFMALLLTCFVVSNTLAQEEAAPATDLVETAQVAETTDVVETTVEEASPEADPEASLQDSSEESASVPSENESSTESTEAIADQQTDEEPTEQEPVEEEPAEQESAEIEDEEADEEDAAEEEGVDFAQLVEGAPDFFAVTHPAVIHFPIALLMFGALFVMVGWLIPSWGQQIPVACLHFGTIAGIVATLTGWWYADYSGYSDWKEFDDWQDGFVQHRWLGVAITIVSIINSFIAIYASRTESKTASFLWKLGLILLALAVAYEGHLGGALIHSTSIEEAFVEWISPSE